MRTNPSLKAAALLLGSLLLPLSPASAAKVETATTPVALSGGFQPFLGSLLPTPQRGRSSQGSSGSRSSGSRSSGGSSSRSSGGSSRGSFGGSSRSSSGSRSSGSRSSFGGSTRSSGSRSSATPSRSSSYGGSSRSATPSRSSSSPSRGTYTPSSRSSTYGGSTRSSSSPGSTTYSPPSTSSSSSRSSSSPSTRIDAGRTTYSGSTAPTRSAGTSSSRSTSRDFADSQLGIYNVQPSSRRVRFPAPASGSSSATRGGSSTIQTTPPATRGGTTRFSSSSGATGTRTPGPSSLRISNARTTRRGEASSTPTRTVDSYTRDSNSGITRPSTRTGTREIDPSTIAARYSRPGRTDSATTRTPVPDPGRDAARGTDRMRMDATEGSRGPAGSRRPSETRTGEARREANSDTISGGRTPSRGTDNADATGSGQWAKRAANARQAYNARTTAERTQRARQLVSRNATEVREDRLARQSTRAQRQQRLQNHQASQARLQNYEASNPAHATGIHALGNASFQATTIALGLGFNYGLGGGFCPGFSYYGGWGHWGGFWGNGWGCNAWGWGWNNCYWGYGGFGWCNAWNPFNYCGYWGWGWGWGSSWWCRNTNPYFWWNNYYNPWPRFYSTVIYQTYDPGPDVIYVEAEPEVIYVEEPYAGEIAAGNPVLAAELDALLAPSAEAQARADKRDALLAQGDLAFREGRYADAVHHYAQAAETSPTEGVLYLVLSDALFATGDYHYAAYSLRKALELDPTLVENIVDKHEFYTDPTEFDRHIAVLERFVQDRPLDQDARLVLGANYLFGNRPAAAVDLLESESAARLREDSSAILLLQSARRVQYGQR